MNEDWIQGGGGFPTHPHQNMEILTWVLEGALEHQDSTGGGGVIRPGVMQHMTAGSGITHSEFNPSPDTATHLYQIWLLPREKGLEPGYEDRTFDPSDWQGKFRTLASPDGKNDSLLIQQDATLSVVELESGVTLSQSIAPSQHSWLQVTSGNILLGDIPMNSGDGAALSDESVFKITAQEKTQVLWFELS